MCKPQGTSQLTTTLIIVETMVPNHTGADTHKKYQVVSIPIHYKLKIRSQSKGRLMTLKLTYKSLGKIMHLREAQMLSLLWVKGKAKFITSLILMFLATDGFCH